MSQPGKDGGNMKRIRSDAALKRLQCTDALTEFENEAQAWKLATDTAFGLRKLTPDERQQIDAEIVFAIAWTNDLKRAIKLELPQAAAHCAYVLTDLFHKLNRFDAMNERNLLIPKARKGELHTASHAAKGRTRKQSAAAHDARLREKIAKLDKRLLTQGYKNELVRNLSTAETLGICERKVRELKKPLAK